MPAPGPGRHQQQQGQQRQGPAATEQGLDLTHLGAELAPDTARGIAYGEATCTEGAALVLWRACLLCCSVASS